MGLREEAHFLLPALGGETDCREVETEKTALCHKPSLLSLSNGFSMTLPRRFNLQKWRQRLPYHLPTYKASKQNQNLNTSPFGNPASSWWQFGVDMMSYDASQEPSLCFNGVMHSFLRTPFETQKTRWWTVTPMSISSPKSNPAFIQSSSHARHQGETKSKLVHARLKFGT